MRNKLLTALCMLFAAVMCISAFAVAIHAETEQSTVTGIAKAEGVPAVFLNGESGSDDYDGLTADTAVATIAKAIELANANTDASNAVIVVTGATSFGAEQNSILPANAPCITLTSYYDGVDYRTNGAKLTAPNFNVSITYFNGDYVWDYVTIETTNKNAILAMQYNDLTVGANVTVVPLAGYENEVSYYPILLLGLNKAMDKAADNPTITDTVVDTVNGGTWQYIRSGDRDSTATFDGSLTVNINGGKFLSNATATNWGANANTNSATGKGNYGENAKIVMNLNGGDLASFACVCYGYTSTTSYADVTVNINSGVTLRDYFCAVQVTNTNFLGKLTVNVNGGDLSSLTKVRLAAKTEAGPVTVNYDSSKEASDSAFRGLNDKCVSSSGYTIFDLGTDEQVPFGSCGGPIWTLYPDGTLDIKDEGMQVQITINLKIYAQSLRAALAELTEMISPGYSMQAASL